MKGPAFDLDGCVVLVTGGAGAIGRAVCAGFAGAGAHVAVLDLAEEAAEAVARTLEGGPHAGVGADLRDVPALRNAVASRLVSFIR